MLRILVVVAAALGLFAAAADAAIVFERDDAIWIVGDDGGARRLAAGQEPHIAPGGATVLYRSLGTGRHIYAVPSAGGPRRRLLTLPSQREAGSRYFDPDLSVDFASGGRHALISPAFGKRTLLVDLLAGTVRRLRVPTFSSVISPDGSQLAWARGRRRCDLDVLDLATGSTRSLARGVCPADAEWGPRGIGVIVDTRGAATLSELDPATGRLRRRFSARRPFGFLEPGATGTWRLEAFQTRGHKLAAWIVRPDGRRLGRDLPHDAFTSPAFTPDDRSVLVGHWNGTLIRIELATGARRSIAVTDHSFDVG